MEKNVGLALNKYTVIPHSVRLSPAQNVTNPVVPVNLARLYHHYYLDSYGRSPPKPDPAHFEHLRFLMPTVDFRFQGEGLGVSKAAKRHRSTELGQAFCRWFLHDHLNITYFAHIEHLLSRQMHKAFGSCAIRRVAAGDAPDYFCAENVDRVFLAEAKGRYTSISFKSKEFNAWRQQFNRVQVVDATGTARSVKGHVVATRFATESDIAAIRTTLFAEDPESAGDSPLEGETARALGTAILGEHYGRIAEKLNQPLLAAALFNGTAIPDEILIQVVSWELALDPVKGRRFIGGYFPGPNGESAFEIREGKIQVRHSDPLRLDAPTGTFFGVEEKIFRQIVSFARSSGLLDRQLVRLDNIEPIYSAISMLRDGSVVGPIEFFIPSQQATL